MPLLLTCILTTDMYCHDTSRSPCDTPLSAKRIIPFISLITTTVVAVNFTTAAAIKNPNKKNSNDESHLFVFVYNLLCIFFYILLLSIIFIDGTWVFFFFFTDLWANLISYVLWILWREFLFLVRGNIFEREKGILDNNFNITYDIRVSYLYHQILDGWLWICFWVHLLL